MVHKGVVVAVVTACGLSGCVEPSGVMVPVTSKPLGGSLFFEEVDDEGFLLYLDGPITADTAVVYQSIAESSEGGSLIILQSPGGTLAAAQIVGRAIDKSGSSVVLLGACASACVDIFIAGRRREMLEGSVLALHTASDREAGYAMSTRYWSDMGFTGIHEQINKLGDNEVWVIEAPEARRLRLATSVVPISEFQ